MKYINFGKLTLLLTILTTLGGSAFAQKLMAKRWVPNEIYGARVGRTNAFVQFASDGKVSGNAGCNRMFGEYTQNGRRLRFSEIGSTRMFCADGTAMKTESALIRAMNATTRFAQATNTLTLFAGNRRVAVFKSVAASDTLESAKWVLINAGGKLIPKTETAAFIVFDREKMSAGGNSSCNAFGGDYDAKGLNLTISGIISTQRACIEDNRMNVEREFFGGLRKTTRYEIRDDKLYLYQNKNLLLTLRAQSKSNAAE